MQGVSYAKKKTNLASLNFPRSGFDMGMGNKFRKKRKSAPGVPEGV
jgi:hypothetical protein